MMKFRQSTTSVKSKTSSQSHPAKKEESEEVRTRPSCILSSACPVCACRWVWVWVWSSGRLPSRIGIIVACFHLSDARSAMSSLAGGSYLDGEPAFSHL
jgi:hypothetical protein